MNALALPQWLAQQHETLTAFVRKRAGKLLLRLEMAEDLAQGICAHLLARCDAIVASDDAARRAWLYVASERWLSDRRDHWMTLKRRGGEVLRLSFGSTAGGSAGGADHLGSVRALAASITGPSTFAVRREQLALAAIALDMLLPRDRELITGLCEGLDLDEQARRLGITYDAAERARLRALDRFRRCFQLARGGHGG